MEVYNAMRHFADSWGMLGMLLFFVVALAFVFLRPGSRQAAADASAIPFKED